MHIWQFYVKKTGLKSPPNDGVEIRPISLQGGCQLANQSRRPVSPPEPLYRSMTGREARHTRDVRDINTSPN
ncbi:hypothetical protein J6590_043093 [Homalodisca vitripennis]|nr:hypothetical protein J6590_043093 [Homalodisca vitripennis]